MCFLSSTVVLIVVWKSGFCMRTAAHSTAERNCQATYSTQRTTDEWTPFVSMMVTACMQVPKGEQCCRVGGEWALDEWWMLISLALSKLPCVALDVIGSVWLLDRVNLLHLSDGSVVVLVLREMTVLVVKGWFCHYYNCFEPSLVNSKKKQE